MLKNKTVPRFQRLNENDITMQNYGGVLSNCDRSHSIRISRIHGVIS